MTEGLTIVFMGTPDFAVPCLETAAAEGYDIPLVVTQPDRRRGRGQKPAPPAVKKTARQLNLPVIQPASIREKDVREKIAASRPDVLVVVAYGEFLPPPVLNIPSRGAVNIHPSLLPAYRGPSPIQWAIINGEKTTGVTSIFMNGGMDAGDIILAETEPIGPEETAGELHDRLAATGASVLSKTLKKIKAGPVRAVPQDHERATYSPKLKKSDGRINWDQPAARLANFIRGMTPWPGAYTFADGKRYKILQARPVKSEAEAPPGTVVKSFPGDLRIKTADEAVSVLKIQGESGKPLSIDVFLRGCPLPENTVFS